MNHSLKILLAGALLSPAPLLAQTLYWNKAAAGLTWSLPTSNQHWTTSAAGSVYSAWSSGNVARIVTANAQINMGGSAVTAQGLVIESGPLTLGFAGAANTALIIDGSTGATGSGSLVLANTTVGGTGSFSVRLASTNVNDAGWNGTITVDALNSAASSTIVDSAASSGLILGAATNGTAATVFRGTGVNTQVLLNGGNLLLGQGTIGATNTATIGSLSGTGAIALQSVFNTNGGTRTLRVQQTANTTMNGTIGGGTITQGNNILALTKAGSGTLSINLTGTSGYAGTTAVEAGVLILNGTLGSSASGGSNVNQGGFTVASGAELGLTGTINSAAAAAITLADGAIFDPGVLTLNSAATTTSKGLVFEGGATMRFSLGAGGDFLTLADTSMNGQAAGGPGGIKLQFTDLGTVAVGATYDLIDFGGTTVGIADSLFALSADSLAQGWAGTIGYFGANGRDANTLQFTVTAVPVPENSTALLVLLALAAPLARRRKSS
jgi:hypothetical protein